MTKEEALEIIRNNSLTDLNKEEVEAALVTTPDEDWYDSDWQSSSCW